MKHFIVLVFSVLITIMGGIKNWRAANLEYPKPENIKFNENKYIKTDTIKPVRTNLGNPYITNYNLSLNEQQIWSICQDVNGLMIFAHRQGITMFDGNHWEQLKLPAIPFVLKPLPKQNIILVGCDNQFGYIKLNDKGLYEYFCLSKENLRPGEITDIKFNDSYIYYYSEESLNIYDRKTLKPVNEWFVQDGVLQNGIIQHGQDVFISKSGKGIFRINNDGKKEYIANSQSFSKYQLAFSIQLSDKNALIGNYGNKLYLFNGKTIRDYNSSANNYISDCQLVGGINLNQNQFALSTLSGGIIILNKANGRIEHIINYQNGLPDDEIFATGKDTEGGLWLSHGFGISRVNYDLPVKDFNYYPGIEGKLIDIIEFENTCYIATTKGVYYLDTLENIQEYKVYIEKPSIKDTEAQKVESENDENITTPVKKKNIFQRWKEKRELRKKRKQNEKESLVETKNEKEEEKEIEKPEKTTKKTKKTKKVFKKKTVRVLKLSYVFKKVKNISGKCKQLLKYNNSILVASNNGLYEIKGKTAHKIIKNVYVNTIVPSKVEGLFYIGTNKGITAVKEDNKGWTEYKKIQPDEFNDDVLSIAEDNGGNLWVGSDAMVYYVHVDKNLRSKAFEMFDFGKDFPDKFTVSKINNQICFLSTRQIYSFNKTTNQIEPRNELISEQLPYYKYIISQPGISWIKTHEKWQYFESNYKLTERQTALLNLFENIQNIRVDQDNNIWVVDGKNNLYKILPTDISESYLNNFNVYIRNIENDHGNYVALENIVIDPGINSLTFEICAPYYLRPEGIRYQYFIVGAMNGWTDWKQSRDFDFLLQPGNYTIKVRAKNIFGDICNSKEYHIKVNSPVWMKTWFIVSVTAAVILLLSFMFFLLQKKKQRKLLRYNKILEAKVEERTSKIKKQKEQIEDKNREITDSLNYASQIQSAILPPQKVINEAVSESFILNIPKDIVSGDYYWANRINGQLIVTAADCTGHGVPGAFLSLLGVTFLNEITSKMENLKANHILEELRNRVISSLHQEGYHKKRLDGIDLSLVVLDLETLEMQFAGANNPIFIIRNGELTEFKGDRMPIGIHSHKDKPFTNHHIETKKGDLIYLFSDGFVDQFGGDYGRKFLSRNFKILLHEISNLPLTEQKTILNETLELWKGKRDQLDDILVVGLKI